MAVGGQAQTTYTSSTLPSYQRPKENNGQLWLHQMTVLLTDLQELQVL